LEQIFKNVLVFLNNHPDDQAVLDGMENFLATDRVHEKIIFLHVSEDLNLPHISFSGTEFSEKKVHVALESSLSKKLKSKFGGSMDYELIVEQGHPVNRLLKICQEEEINLVILSEPNEEAGGLNTKQFVRHSPSSILIVKRDYPLGFQRILVPLDCSHYSMLILKHILLFEAIKNHSKVHFLHIYPRPSSFYKSGLNFEEFVRIAKSHAEKEVSDFLAKDKLEGLEFDSEVIMDPGHNIAKSIIDSAKKQGSSLIIIGSKGKTGMASILLGSVTENLLSHEEEVSVLIVKDANERLNLREALKKI
jgi:nucleotide-binding universal stress UspA family protein